jgi:CDP-glycerol glycerophosphotransferase
LNQTFKESIKRIPVVGSMAKRVKPVGYFLLRLGIRALDWLTPKDASVWIFPVHFFTHSFSDNVRAVYEAVKDDPRIKKIILYRGEKPSVYLTSASTILCPMGSRQGLRWMLRAKVIFIQHSVHLDFKPLRVGGVIPLRLHARKIVNLWHGIALKSITAASTGIHDRQFNREKKHYTIMAASDNDKLVMCTAFYPVNPKNVFVTGTPRSDFLIQRTETLPADYKTQLEALLALKGDRRLIVYAPTYREKELGGRNYTFSAAEVERLRCFLSHHQAVLGFRLHYYNRTLSYQQLFDDEMFFDLDQSLFPDMSMIIRAADVIISDYSGLVIDAMYVNKPVVLFAYDYAHYQSAQRGLTYPLELASSFPICKSFDPLMEQLEKALQEGASGPGRKTVSRPIFYAYSDGDNGKRVIGQIKAIIR